MGRGEVITLQFGTFANFVGAHYWNIQVWFPGALLFTRDIWTICYVNMPSSIYLPGLLLYRMSWPAWQSVRSSAALLIRLTQVWSSGKGRMRGCAVVLKTNQRLPANLVSRTRDENCS